MQSAAATSTAAPGVQIDLDSISSRSSGPLGGPARGIVFVLLFSHRGFRLSREVWVLSQ